MDTSTLSANLQQHPLVSQWLKFEHSKAFIFPGKVDIGQGITTALIQIASEELGVRPDQIKAQPASTAFSPNEAVTSGSLSIQECGFAIRHVCALAHSALVDYAKTRFAVQVEPRTEQCYVKDGQLHTADGKALCSYWDLAFTELFADQTCLTFPLYRNNLNVFHNGLARLDLPAKFRGQAGFIHDMRPTGLRFSLMLRGAASKEQIKTIRLALASKQIPQSETSLLAGGPALLVDGDFVALTCNSITELADYQLIADRAIARTTQLPKTQSIGDPTNNDWLMSAPTQQTIVFNQSLEANDGDQAATKTAIGTAFEATFDKPWLSHASIGLSCALALYKPGECLQIWSHTQGIFNLRADLFLALKKHCDLSETQFIVQHVEGAGCYGHNGADDVAFDAARIALFYPNVPIRVQWTRAQELACAPFSPAMRVKVKAQLSNATPKKISSWQQSIWSNGHSLRPGRAASPTLLGSAELASGTEPRVSVNAAASMGYGSERNAQPIYEIEHVHVENFRLTQMPIRSSAFRGLGAIANVFAIESMMDEMAKYLKEDPLDFRLRHLNANEHFRAQTVLMKVALMSSWKAQQVKKDTLAEDGIGYGLGFARYKNTGAWCAVVAKVKLQEKVYVLQLWIAADVGKVVNDDGVRSQLEGAAIQSTSIALLENARFAGKTEIAPSWDDYPILKFSDVPAIEIELINLSNEPSLGAGEPATAPVVAAIANAVASVIGTSCKSLPLIPETIASTIALS
jgi:CO/xanthine dehydrogenase Mo-binding subunit